MHICYDYTAKDVTDRKKNKKAKNWMPQDAAEYAQHSGHFAAHSINLDSILLEYNSVNGCYFS